MKRDVQDGTLWTRFQHACNDFLKGSNENDVNSQES